MMRNAYCIIILYIFICFTLISGADVEPKNEVERKLLKFLQKWRSGSTSISLPKLDVINICPLDGRYTGKAGVDITYSTSEMQLTGMDTFSVVDIKVLLGLAEMHASGELFIPKLQISGEHYSLKGKAFHLYNLKGSGKIYIGFEDINVIFVMKISNNATSSCITTFQPDFIVSSIEVDLENSSWPVNKVLNRDGVKIIEGFRDEIITAAQTNIVKSLNPYLANTTPIQLLDSITKCLLRAY